VGGRLSAPSSASLTDPVGPCVKRPSPPAPSIAFVLGSLHHSPGDSRHQGRGGSAKLFAVASFGRIAARRTSQTGAFSAPRMRTPRGPSRTLWSLHRTVSTSDVLGSPAGTPESDPVRPMCCPCVSAFALQPTEAHGGVDLLVRGPCFAPGVETRAGKSPRTPFVVSRTCEPKPTGDVLRKPV